MAPMAGDAPLKALRHRPVWEKVARSIPHVAHWIDGEPLTDVLARPASWTGIAASL
jgi:hypothetical protein